VFHPWLLFFSTLAFWPAHEETVGLYSMISFETTRLPLKTVATAPDGTAVRPLLQLLGGSLAHFELATGQTSKAVSHRTVEEIWYFLGGQGELWRKSDNQEEIVHVDAGVSLTIPLGTSFQFRSLGNEPLVMVVITMPPWPGADEAYEVRGAWEPTI
jgi:mannose-6-phosphate isomerase-like protein (cupin superfamily)